jgi:hypothetical protein
MYDEKCCTVHSCHGLHGLRCLTATGIFFTILFTYTGFACLLTGRRRPRRSSATEQR